MLDILSLGGGGGYLISRSRRLLISTVQKSPKDLTLIVSGGDPAADRLAKIGRIVGACLIDRSVPLEVRAISMALGVSETHVREILAAPEFHEIVRSLIKAKTGAAIGRGIDSMVEIIEHGADKDKIASFRALVASYQTVSDAETKHDEKEAQQQVIKLLDRVAGISQTKAEVR